MGTRGKASAPTGATRREQRWARASAGHWPRWSRQWNWVARAGAYDAWIEATHRSAERERSKQLERRRWDFEFANQERLETRCEKKRALLAKAGGVPIDEIPRWT